MLDLPAGRGINVHRSTLYRRVIKFSPEMIIPTEEHLRRANLDGHMDETHIRVGGKLHDLWRTVSANRQLVKFRLTAQRDAKAIKVFLNKAIECVRLHRPVTVATDKSLTYRDVL